MGRVDRWMDRDGTGEDKNGEKQQNNSKDGRVGDLGTGWWIVSRYMVFWGCFGNFVSFGFQNVKMVLPGVELMGLGYKTIKNGCFSGILRRPFLDMVRV